MVLIDFLFKKVPKFICRLVPCRLASDRASEVGHALRALKALQPYALVGMQNVILMPGLRQIPRSKGTRQVTCWLGRRQEVEQHIVRYIWEAKEYTSIADCKGNFRCLDCAGILPRDVRHSRL